jgi:hypothetical protein
MKDKKNPPGKGGDETRGAHTRLRNHAEMQ